MRGALAIATALALVGAQPALAQSPEPQASLPDIADEVMCVVCGVPLELSPDAPQAQAELRFIRRLIAEGKTKDEIKDALVVEYGEDVLATPGNDGFDLAAWLIPAAAFLTAAIAIAIALRRWRRRDGSDEPPMGDPEPDPEASDRLNADMAHYEL